MFENSASNQSIYLPSKPRAEAIASALPVQDNVSLEPSVSVQRSSMSVKQHDEYHAWHVRTGGCSGWLKSPGVISDARSWWGVGH